MRMLVGLTALSFLAGCASVPMAPDEADQKAKQFEAPPDKAVIYVFRDINLGTAVTVPIWLDGRMSGALAVDTYFRWPVSPGEYKVASKMQNYSSVTLNAQAGKAYFVRAKTQMGWTQPRVKLNTLPLSEAKSYFSEMEMAADQR